MDLQANFASVSASTGSWDQRACPDEMKVVALRHLKTRAEIEAILHMREGIDLSALTGDGNFLTLEKKETSVASCSASTFTASS